MTELDLLAADLGLSGRTLRRAVARGTLRGARSDGTVELPPREHEYVREHWPLIERMLAVLRTRPNVRLAVLFGSTARGTHREDSDVDLLVRVGADWMDRVEAGAALELALGRPVQLVPIETAPALLLADVLRDGRVLADRDREWAHLGRRVEAIEKAAAEDATKLDDLAWETLERFDELVAL